MQEDKPGKHVSVCYYTVLR